VSKDERDLLVATAWLHDIGYAPELRQTGFHPLDGARHLESVGAPARLVQLVAHHSGAIYEAELAVYEREDSPVLDALIFADMTTGPAGQSFDFDTWRSSLTGLPANGWPTATGAGQPQPTRTSSSARRRPLIRTTQQSAGLCSARLCPRTSRSSACGRTACSTKRLPPAIHSS
jgi:hypothetical protein